MRTFRSYLLDLRLRARGRRVLAKGKRAEVNINVGRLR